MINRTETGGQACFIGLEDLLRQLSGAYRQSLDLFDAQINAVINGDVAGLEVGTAHQLEQQELLQQLEAGLRTFMDRNAGYVNSPLATPNPETGPVAHNLAPGLQAQDTAAGLHDQGHDRNHEAGHAGQHVQEPKTLRRVLEESGRSDLVAACNELVRLVGRTVEKRDQLSGLLEFARSHTNDVIRMLYGSAAEGGGAGRSYTQKGGVREHQATPMAINKRI